jgi:zinc/manganese transport system substrate-binding protein
VTLQSWARAEVATLPADRRVLVTSHDAFGYLAREFGFTVHPILGASTADEASPRHLAAVIDLVRRQRVRTVFAEATSSPRLLETLARETKTRLGPPLWADGLGTEPENATIEAMFRHNLSAIVAGLRAE